MIALPLSLSGTRVAYNLYIIKICLLKFCLSGCKRQTAAAFPNNLFLYLLFYLITSRGLRASSEYWILSATTPPICEVARICPSKYGSLHINLQALLPQLGSDVVLARYVSLPVPPVPPRVRPLRRCRRALLVSYALMALLSMHLMD